jgi:hypothetical protein
VSSPEQRRRAKDLRLRKVYNITIDEYEELLAHQGGKCAYPPCQKKFEEGKRFSVDHNHQPPYEVRGIVCYQDNRYRIGSFTADEAYSLWLYLSNPPATEYFRQPRSVPPGMEQGQKRTRKKRKTVKRDPRGRKS